VVAYSRQNNYLARPAAESRHGGLSVKFMVLAIYLFYFIIPVRPTISKSTGPISAKFSGLVELWLY